MFHVMGLDSRRDVKWFMRETLHVPSGWPEKAIRGLRQLLKVAVTSQAHSPHVARFTFMRNSS